jgi:hypothetical protein
MGTKRGLSPSISSHVGQRKEEREEMVARAGGSLQHASPCFAGPTMCSPFSLCDRRRRVEEETTHARSGTIRPPVPEHGRRRSCLRRGRGRRAIARRGVSRSPAKQEAGSSWPVFRLAGGRRAGAGEVSCGGGRRVDWRMTWGGRS